MHRTLILLAIGALAVHGPNLTAAGPEPPAPPGLGATVPDFQLKDCHRRPRSLADYKDRKAFVIVFLDTECPMANLYVPSLIALHKEYAPRGVAFFGINSSAQDSFTEVSAHAQERGIPFPILKDFDQKTAGAFGARRTCEAYVLDAGRTIRYHGRIDDQYGVGTARPQPTRSDLARALDDLLAGRPVATPRTRAVGCPLERADNPYRGRALTYARDVAPIVQEKCQECHRPGAIGPFSLLDYRDVRKRTARIREAVLEQRMPPWHADPRHGRFLNDRRLTDEQRDMLLAWIDSGAPMGDPEDAPPPRKFVEGWRYGEPDRIYSMEKEFEVPASGVLDYQRFLVDPGFSSDVWVRAAECRPGNRKVVHHMLVYVLAPGRFQPYDADGTAATLVGWAPGDMPVNYPDGIARLVPAHSKLLFEVHYTPNGTKQTDRSTVGVWFASGPPKHAAETNILANLLLRIPPGAADYKGQLTYTFPRDAWVLCFMPHMHLRGTSARYDLAYPDGKTETLLFVPDYDFGWQSSYRFEKPIVVPKGSRLTWTAHWDNSADNPRNPDPSKTVRWGLQTWDEMQNGWMEVVWLGPKGTTRGERASALKLSAPASSKNVRQRENQACEEKAVGRKAPSN